MSNNILKIGVNQMGDTNGKQLGIHAECDAILKLPYLNNKKKLQLINILVIRVSSRNKLQSSKPCAHCIETMNYIPYKKGYKIKYVYYSDENECIIKTTLKELSNEQDKHYSRLNKI